MKTDIEIAREIPLLPINEIGKKLGLSDDQLVPYGHHIAKVPHQNIDNRKVDKSNLILVTAITPTRAGIGKTTTSIGLTLGLEKLGKKTVVALREPSLGVCFGMKGGAAGGGYAQVLPMEDINLHFTGDFHAITSAHNMISALLDNYQYQNRHNGKGLKQVLWKRVLDVNDRALREITTGLGGTLNGVPAESGFDITPASEIMAIICLATGVEDLTNRIESILLGYTFDNEPFSVKDLGVGGAIVVLLKDAINPNLVQTTEHTPAFIHGGPFANIAHGCNSAIATKMALTLGDYVITEAGFGADLGAEKFLNLKCRTAGLSPKLTVLVATSQALKLHDGVGPEDTTKPNLDALKSGLDNLKKHVENLINFGQSVVVAFNQYDFDTEEELNFIRTWCSNQSIPFALNSSFKDGGEGALELAELVVKTIDENPSSEITYTYDLEDSIKEKVEKVASKIYGAKKVTFDNKADKMIKKINKFGYDRLPICIAKTQYSFSDDPKKNGVPKEFIFHVEDLIINSGAGFIVVKAGSIMRMPGLPKVPQANTIKIENGNIEGLS
ncbi:MAG: formate--tetrahydrofolate ligase [Cytophagales bacterium]|nr:formate--tetrahydrofolate ligase [Cytophagales bacterium]